jgi:O-antigen ligase
VGAAAVVATPSTFGIHFDNLNLSSSGRAGLIKGGVKLFSERPVIGFGPGSFEKEYRKRHRVSPEATGQASHTIPITVAAEQGLVGFAVYVALLVAAFLRLFREARRTLPRAAFAAAFTGLVLHTFLYAAFLEDPMTWTLLGIGTALAWGATRSSTEQESATESQNVQFAPL